MVDYNFLNAIRRVMDETETIDVSHIEFTSTVYPTEEDMKLWYSLSAAEQRAVIYRDVEAALKSGIAEKQSMAEIITEARAEMANDR